MNAFHYDVNIRLLITSRELQVLTRFSNIHYDLKARKAGIRGGFIYGWGNRMGNDRDEMHIYVDAHQLGTCLKILEAPDIAEDDLNRRKTVLRFKLEDALTELKKEYEKVNEGVNC